ncbi:MAG: alanine--tRNA ligase [Eubacteriales bacterium]|nr:alanine--tRNA ligase [Eubacteriales bacterium]MDD4105295.1 alanine--tRNA ligase [Eubacteriales bacterium]MDD4710822.1 alanine--tRNA ligase [Eubacteriales bacterium]
MKKLTANQLRHMFLTFFEARGHAIIPSSSITPENDPTVLFTTAGMHPLVPYLMGQKHPQGNRLANVQKCIRTGDIDDVGDASHLTFFEMMGNWSLGDYFKKEMIPWSWEFLTSGKYLAIDPNRLAFSVFAGDSNAPRDDESYELWRQCGVKPENIYYLPKENNWWGPAGLTGPCGPDTEMFIINDKEPCGPDCSPACDCGRFLEIWNDVFMQYNKTADGNYEPLAQQNVDTGMGLERTICVLNGAKSVYETEMFSGIIAEIERLSGKTYLGADDETMRFFRIVSDHLRTATFILGDNSAVTPSNVDQGYVLRRLIRRAVRFGMQLGLEEGFTADIAMVIINQYAEPYPELEAHRAFVLEQLLLEEKRFQRTLKQGIREFDKMFSRMTETLSVFHDMQQKLGAALVESGALRKLHDAQETAENVGSSLRPTPEMQQMAGEIKKFSDAVRVIEEFADKSQAFISAMGTVGGREAFKLYDTFGFPIEMTTEMAGERGLEVDLLDFEERFKKHQELSHAGAEQRFKGGLADAGEQTTRLHTATHLLQAALRKVLGPEVGQKGSNITAERLRFDFTFGRKMTGEELAQVEKLVNDAIKAEMPITMQEMTVEEAKEQGAIGLFESKYGERVKVYSMGDFSKEICGGPHANNTGDLKSFKIQKEESSSAGVRRIKAVVGEE